MLPLGEGFYWSLSVIKAPKVPRTLLSILTDFNNAVVWMISIHPSIFTSSSSLTKPMGIVPSAPLKIGITITFKLNSFFQLSDKV